MAGSKRERELHRAKLARQEKEAAAAAERRRKRLQIGAAVTGTILVLAIVIGVAAAVSSSDDDSPAPASIAKPTAPATVAPSDPAKTAKVKCAPVTDKKPNGRQFTYDEATQLTLKEDGVYKELLTTNCGEIELTLDNDAPNTVKVLTYLSDQGKYFNNTVCHRLTTSGIYVLQCGDPEGTGSGGPGFTMAEENLPEGDPNEQVIYPRGTVAMAKTSAPGSTGSQFFLVYKDSPLTPVYTVVGKITKGMDILDHIAGKGVEGGGEDGAPKQPLQINKMVSSVTTPYNQ